MFKLYGIHIGFGFLSSNYQTGLFGVREVDPENAEEFSTPKWPDRSTNNFGDTLR